MVASKSSRKQNEGPILINRSGSMLFVFLLTGLGLVLAPAGIAVIGNAQLHPELTMLGVVITLCALASWFGAWYLASFRFRCYENGVEELRLFSRKWFRYEDLLSFGYYESIIYYKSTIPISFTYALTFVPRPESGQEPIHFSIQPLIEEPIYQELRDHVSTILAEQMLAAFEKHGIAAWTRNMVLEQTGLRCVTPAASGSQQSFLIPYANICDHVVEGREFRLYRDQDKQPCLIEDTLSLNFFPGLLVFESILDSEDEQEEQQGSL